MDLSDTDDKVVGAKYPTFFYINAMKLKLAMLWLTLTVIGMASAAAVTGQHGELFSASKVNGIKSGETITVSGKKFDVTVGVYIEMCQVVPTGILPTIWGGGVNMAGSGAASFWISSNPPSYGTNLALPFKPGGSFSVGLKVQPKIGKVDCRKVPCAIYVRADHTRTQDRTHDIKIPITFSK